MFCFAFHTRNKARSSYLQTLKLRFCLMGGEFLSHMHQTTYSLNENDPQSFSCANGILLGAGSWVVWAPFKLRKKSSLDLVMVTADGIWRQKLCFPSGWLWNVSPFSNLVYWYHFHRACFFVCMSSYGSLYCMKASDRREWKCLPADVKLYADTGDQHGACARP